VSGALAEAKKALGGLTGIVNCSGSILLKPAHLTSRADFDQTMDANLVTAFAAVRSAKAVFGREGGSVVLLSSAAASFGMGNHEAIAAAKGAIEGLVRSAAATYAPSGIRFNAVAPGLVETPLSAPITAAPAARKLSESLHPLGHLGQPEDIASAIAWFLDPAQRWVTGQVLGVDGGLSRVQPRPRVSPAT
jgi:NAD(P)-dependent dehydrogenase (short-subunit alcohol dehydrogenase family)